MTSGSSNPSPKRIHHAVRYSDLSLEWYDFFNQEKIFPEIAFRAEDLDHMNHEAILRLEKDLHQRNLGLSIHAPFSDLAPGAFDDKIREVTQHRFDQVLNLAEILKPNIVDCHPHYDRYRYGGRIDQWVEKCAATLDPVVKRAEKLKIVLALENTFEGDPTPLQNLLEKLSSPSLRLCFDNGHFHIFHKVSLKRWWEILGKKIVLLHLHDNHGETDEHLPLGEGNFPFPAYFNLLKEHPQEMTYTLECHSLAQAQKTLKAFRKFF